MSPIYRDFQVGQTWIFLVTKLPATGPVQGYHDYHVRSLESLEFVEACLARADSWHDAEVEWISASHPVALVSAAKARARLRERAAWFAAETARDVTTLSEGERAKERQRQQEAEAAFDKDIGEAVEGASVPSLHALLALGWREPEDAAWANSWKLGDAVRKFCEAHADEVRTYWERQARTILRKARVTDDDIAGYFEALKTSGIQPQLASPFEAPSRYGSSKKLEGRAFTTDFILRFESYDRSEIFRGYFMDRESLAALDVDRVSDIVAALWHSRADELRDVAYWIIRQVQGTRFVKLVADDMRDGRPFAWKVFDDIAAPAWRTECLRMLAEAGDGEGNEWIRAQFWAAMRAGGCFDSAALPRAIGALRDIEREDPGTSKNASVTRELVSYLQDAHRAHGGGKEVLLTSEEFAKFFGK